MMETIRVDAKGLRCPQPVLKLAMVVVDKPKGTLIEIEADCPTFEKDIRSWCERKKIAVLSVRGEGAAKLIQVQL
jgi:tRNA 2-thiouridine synthesizing protein A